MHWSRAVHHVETLAQSCAAMAERPSTMFPLRVVSLWAVSDLLGPAREVDSVTVALAVDLPADQVAWLTEPPGSRHWSDATRLSRSPVAPRWRSAHAPVWNHRIVRPALLWSATGGVSDETVAALRAGRGDAVREPARPDTELLDRLHDELAVSRQALQRAATAYADRRWRPGKLTPVSDDLWRASEGYLDVLAGLEELTSGAGA